MKVSFFDSIIISAPEKKRGNPSPETGGGVSAWHRIVNFSEGVFSFGNAFTLSSSQMNEAAKAEPLKCQISQVDLGTRVGQIAFIVATVALIVLSGIFFPPALAFLAIPAALLLVKIAHHCKSFEVQSASRDGGVADKALQTAPDALEVSGVEGKDRALRGYLSKVQRALSTFKVRAPSSYQDFARIKSDHQRLNELSKALQGLPQEEISDSLKEQIVSTQKHLLLCLENVGQVVQKFLGEVAGFLINELKAASHEFVQFESFEDLLKLEKEFERLKALEMQVIDLVLDESRVLPEDLKGIAGNVLQKLQKEIAALYAVVSVRQAEITKLINQVKCNIEKDLKREEIQNGPDLTDELGSYLNLLNFMDTEFKEYLNSVITQDRELILAADKLASSERPVGLINLGNSCYMNSITQLILNTPYLRHQLINAQSAFKEESKHEQGMLDSLFEIDREIKTIQIAPKARSSGWVKSLFGLMGPKSSPSPETLKKLRDSLYGAGALAYGLYAQNDAAEAINPILDLIGAHFFLRKRIITETGHLSEGNIESTTLLTLNVAGSLKESLSHYFSSEDVDFNDYNLPRPGCDFTTVNSKQTYRFEGAPPPLILVHLKRFEAMRDASGRMVLKKISDFIDVKPNEEYDLSAYFGGEGTPDSLNAKYRLRAFVVHEGGISGGHYYSLVKKGENWYKCDDVNVDVVSDVEKESRKGYIFALELSQ